MVLETFRHFLDSAPTPWHAGEALAERLREAGFLELEEGRSWRLERGKGYFVRRDQSSLIAFRLGAPRFRLVTAHTDSPGLRLKPRAPHEAGGFLRLGVEVYGGPILATWSDRELSLAGRVALRSGELKLVDFSEPICRLPNLPIHINRKVNEEGLKFDRQKQLHLLVELLEGQLEPLDRFLELLAERAGCPKGEILSFELAPYEAVPARIWGVTDETTPQSHGKSKRGFIGAEGQFLASGRLDNLASCFAAVAALIEASSQETTPICALFDHEEIGSVSHKGAESLFLPSVLERIAAALGAPLAEILPRSTHLSADMAHAFNPNFPESFDPHHRPHLNRGVVFKENAGLRYMADPALLALAIALCEEEGIPYQFYVHRNDIPCGSTIGPIVSRLGLRTLDVGMPLWAMHSIRECMGTGDLEPFIRLLAAFYRTPQGAG